MGGPRKFRFVEDHPPGAVRTLGALVRLRAEQTPELQLYTHLGDGERASETLSAALPLGVVAYIVKPPRLGDLKSKIEAALASL